MEHRRRYSPNILTGFSNIILGASVFVRFVYISHDGVGLCLICDLSLVVCLSNLKRLIPALSLPSFSSLHHHFAFFPHILRLTPPSLSFFVSFPPASSRLPSQPPVFLHLSSSPSLLSSLSPSPLPVALGRNQPLKRERPKWKSDYPMTEGQLRSKRDEFWDTAPAFEGRKEIWDALRAAASAFESNDHLLAQAILDGASITLPHGNAHLTVEDVVDTSSCFTPHEVPLGGRYVGHAVDDYHLKNFNSLFPNPLELLKLRSSAIVLVFCASFDMREVPFSF